jgi:poly(A) polymerase
MTNRDLAIAIIRRLRERGHEALLAGGCVRDRLLGRRPKDYDVATSARPDEVRRLFRKTLAIGAQFGVIVILEGPASVEVATFRSDEPYRDGRHPSGVQFTTAEEDARRRDFTINALFYDPPARRVIDYVGGVKDLQRGLIRAVGDPEARFREDHLRMLRAARFSARLGFRLAPPTRQAITRLAPLIKKTSGERIRAELEMMLTAPSRVAALKLLDSLGLLSQILPEVVATKGCRQGSRHHPEGDVWRHSLLAVGSLKRPSFALALAVLLHDVGKPPTAVYTKDAIHFYGHQQVGAEMAAKVARRLKLSAAEQEEICWSIQHHLDFMQVQRMRLATLKRIFHEPHFKTLVQVHRADAMGSRGSLADYRYVMRVYRRMSREEMKPEPLVRGEDILALGLAPGPAVGRVLRQLYDEQLDGHLQDRREALARARELVSEERA